MERHPLHRRNFLLHLQTRPGYDGPVPLKEAAHQAQSDAGDRSPGARPPARTTGAAPPRPLTLVSALARYGKTILVQLGVSNSTVILGFNAQLPECFASDYAPSRHLDQGTEKEQLLIYLRRETLVSRLIQDNAWPRSLTTFWAPFPQGDNSIDNGINE